MLKNIKEPEAIIIGSIITAVAAIIAAIIAGTLAIRAVQEQQKAQATNEVLVQEVTQSISTQAALNETVVAPSITPSSTASSLPTATAHPTETPKPTIAPTETPTPTETHTSTATFVPGQILFEDNFDVEPNSMWEIQTGTWRMTNGQFTADTSDFLSKILVGDKGWADYTIDFDVFAGPVTGYPVRVIVRAQSNGDYMAFQSDCCSSEWLLVRGTTEKVIAEDNDGFVNDYGKTHFQVKVIGQTYLAYVDGVLIIQTQDPTFSAGKVGIATYYIFNDDRYMFDNFKVMVP